MKDSPESTKKQAAASLSALVVLPLSAVRIEVGGPIPPAAYFSPRYTPPGKAGLCKSVRRGVMSHELAGRGFSSISNCPAKASSARFLAAPGGCHFAFFVGVA